MSIVGDSGDLQSALSNNHVPFTSPPVEVLHELTGENEERDWHWLVRLADGRCAYVTGGCDSTGWDCHSNCEAHEADEVSDVLRLVGDVQRQAFLEMIEAGEKYRRAP